MLDCHIVVNLFEFQLHYYVHFQTNVPWKNYKSPYPFRYELVQLLFFYKDGFGIKWPTKVGIPLKKSNQTQKEEIR